MKADDHCSRLRLRPISLRPFVGGCFSLITSLWNYVKVPCQSWSQIHLPVTWTLGFIPFLQEKPLQRDAPGCCEYSGHLSTQYSHLWFGASCHFWFMGIFFPATLPLLCSVNSKTYWKCFPQPLCSLYLSSFSKYLLWNTVRNGNQRLHFIFCATANIFQGIFSISSWLRDAVPWQVRRWFSLEGAFYQSGRRVCWGLVSSLEVLKCRWDEFFTGNFRTKFMRLKWKNGEKRSVDIC